MRVEAIGAGTTVLATSSHRLISAWLSELPEAHRDSALKAWEAWRSRNPTIPQLRGSLGEALTCAFPWHKTRQGAEYWLEVYESVTGTITPCVSTPSSNSLTINANKFGGFFEY